MALIGMGWPIERRRRADQPVHQRGRHVIEQLGFVDTRTNRRPSVNPRNARAEAAAVRLAAGRLVSWFLIGGQQKVPAERAAPALLEQ
jgi:hypothetical protein